MLFDERPKNRKIIHVDMDAFYASVEIRDNPALAGKPVVIGGAPNSRGVVATASYEARKFGIHSAMSCAQAYRRCPQAIFVSPRFEAYREDSNRIRDIFRRYTEIIEPLSLDEAFLDVTDNAENLYAYTIAKSIQRAVFEELKLTCSCGVASNKLLAKIASDFKKPAGITVVLPDLAQEFMAPLKVGKIPGVGPVMQKKLLTLGVENCEDAWSLSIAQLRSHFGKMGEWLYDRSRGVDDRPVCTSRERKSLSTEQTFAKDIIDQDKLDSVVVDLAQQVSDGLKKRSLKGRTVTLKVKYSDFQLVTRSHTFGAFTNENPAILENARLLLEKTEAGDRPIRLIGIGLSNLQKLDAE